MAEACASVGALLPEIRETAANEAILKIRKDPGTTFVISGGNDEAEEGKWVWPSDGQVFYIVKRIQSGRMAARYC